MSSKNTVKLNLISAACENLGIGKNGDLPWKLEKEYAYFERMTTETEDKNKRNVMIMGRKTWESFVEYPTSDRICLVLSRSKLDVGSVRHVHVYHSFDEAINALEQDEFFKNKFETVWVIGGTSIYKKGLESDRFHRLYLTRIHKNYDCDTFFPNLPSNLVEVRDPQVPEDIQEEHGIQYKFHIYEK
ncbi:dihydrofolate reductase-like [Sitophilus oryzae]|uniref:dihydrofolate reductase n=1 Tax=Sitophilus oryzae TaxID=7048 RepID=A0A6J2YA79_SITOR|nr:dihydrofolate reductase-like [Sitophilus oryzae]